MSLLAREIVVQTPAEMKRELVKRMNAKDLDGTMELIADDAVYTVLKRIDGAWRAVHENLSQGEWKPNTD
jgi:hypothetical protein